MSRQIILDVITSEPLIYYGADSFKCAVEQGDLCGLYLIGSDIYFFTEGNILNQISEYSTPDDIFYTYEDSEGQLQIFPLMFKPE